MHAVLVSVYILLVTPITLSSWAASAVNQQLHPKHLVMDPNQVCMKYHRSGKPPSMCHKPKLLRQISYGVALGLNECQYQFRFRRWNCTAEKRSMKKVMLRDTRETGFVNAIIAAGVTYQVTRACTKGDLIGCTCHKKIRQRKKQKSFVGIPKGRWAWDICGGDNIDYGIRRSKDFLDWRHKNKNHTDVKNLVKLHNFVAGRLSGLVISMAWSSFIPISRTKGRLRFLTGFPTHYKMTEKTNTYEIDFIPKGSRLFPLEFTLYKTGHISVFYCFG